MELPYKVVFSKDGGKKFDKLDGSIQRRLIEKIKELGDMRIVFGVIEETKTVWVVDIGFRGSVYREW